MSPQKTLLSTTRQSSTSWPRTRPPVADSSGNVKMYNRLPHVSLGGLGYEVRLKPAMVAARWAAATATKIATARYLVFIIPSKIYGPFSPPYLVSSSLKKESANARQFRPK